MNPVGTKDSNCFCCCWSRPRAAGPDDTAYLDTDTIGAFRDGFVLTVEAEPYFFWVSKYESTGHAGAQSRGTKEISRAKNLAPGTEETCIISSSPTAAAGVRRHLRGGVPGGFGHAGAQSRGTKETSRAKNLALASARDDLITVPASFDTLGEEIARVYEKLVANGSVGKFTEPEPPTMPKDMKSLEKLGVVRPNPANIVCSISDDRGDEVTYCGFKLSSIVESEVGIGGTISLLWFKRQLPPSCCKFLEMILVICADHGPAVSGAHNAIVCARAGKDVVDSLCSGLLTIGPRFGGALDNAAKSFTKAFDQRLSPNDYVNDMKKRNELIMGIGHRIKSKHNPDKRVELLRDYALAHWSSSDVNTSVLGFALGVEEVTLKKKANLILNVDGCIAAAFVDMLRSCRAFTREEADQLVAAGCLNGLFVLARSIGFIGHILDQKRLNQGLYRHPFHDIAYIEDKAPQSPRGRESEAGANGVDRKDRTSIVGAESG